jgi:hypothetical protein
VAFFYAKAHGDDPGFYGWAVVLEFHNAHDDNKTLYFRPVSPTNHLKMHPWWNDEAQNIANQVRGPVAQGNWAVISSYWQTQNFLIPSLGTAVYLTPKCRIFSSHMR